MSLDAKRLFDILAAALLAVVLFPLLVLIALLVRVLLGAPVLFTQQRPGYLGRPFTLYKFRTLRSSSTDGKHWEDAARMTSFGRWLRASSLDELPELFNVLRGDMSLVGPRPLLLEYLPLYTPEQARRHEVRPGITGPAQISGRNAISWNEKFRLDVWYVDNRSFWVDLRILAQTVWKVLRREGITQPGEATVRNFRGSVAGDE